MAISPPREISTLGNSSNRTRRPSLYAAFTVACVVQKLKERLRSHAHGSRLSPQEVLTTSTSCKSHGRPFAKDQNLEQDSLKSGTDPPILNSPLKTCAANIEDIVDIQAITTLGRRGDRRQNCTRILLDKLDTCAPPHRVSTATIAADDALFLGYDARNDVFSKDITALGKLVDITSALLGRLQSYFSSLDRGATKNADNLGLFDGPDLLLCRKTAANLEHMLLCLQSAALDSLIYCYLKVAEAEFVHWHSYWQQRWQTGDAWFAEWPSGRRPLSTTWPWNVRPSLLVLWGVCWMFYGNEGPRKPQAAEFLSEHFRTGQPPRLPPHFSHTATMTSSSAVWAASTPGNLQSLVESHPQHSPRKITNSTGFSDYYTLSTSASPSPYISASPSTSSASFATLANCWPHNQGIIQGIDPASDYTYAPSYNLNAGSRLPHEQNSIILRPVPDLESVSSVDPYAAQYNPAVAYEPGGSVTGAEPSIGHPKSNMPGYPSPHSDMSDHRVSPCPSVFPAMNVTPKTGPYPTESRASSTYGSPQSARSEEPTRNDEGVLYCSHKKCEDSPPTFTRKCEWSKHMDKHNRPYICEERGCEKILGFTYSGGLLRHQREVHRQHGGPKASCMCPHSDCKRSTGTGFSRRENLIEHLRRVHRGVEDRSTDSPFPKGPEKKRRRAANDETKDENEDSPEESKRRKTLIDDDGVKDQSESKDLQAKVKQLELELLQKDERLRRLEETVERLAKGQSNL